MISGILSERNAGDHHHLAKLRAAQVRMVLDSELTNRALVSREALGCGRFGIGHGDEDCVLGPCCLVSRESALARASIADSCSYHLSAAFRRCP
jgi:hypothetical protein